MKLTSKQGFIISSIRPLQAPTDIYLVAEWVLFRGHGTLASLQSLQRLESTVTVTINKQKQVKL